MRIAIVEDEEESREDLKGCITAYMAANAAGTEVQIFEFRDGEEFLTGYRSVYDIIFMDIEMPGMTGMRTAEKLREIDEGATLIFVTKMAQFAINGYEVNAFDYILKPISRPRFNAMFSRVLKRRQRREQGDVYVVKTAYGTKSLSLSQIAYVEIVGHRVIYHADETVEEWGSLNAVEKRLPADSFVRIGSSYIVNLRYVTGVKGYEV